MKLFYFQISNAFSEMRREVGILGKLKHPCIVAFIGVCVSPQLLVMMELAPLGSLRSQLERCKPIGDSYGDGHTMIETMVFPKDLTYKIIFQVSLVFCFILSFHYIYFKACDCFSTS